MSNWNIVPAILFYLALLTSTTILAQFIPGGVFVDREPEQWVRTLLLVSNGIIIYTVAWWFKVALDTRDKVSLL